MRRILTTLMILLAVIVALFAVSSYSIIRKREVDL